MIRAWPTGLAVFVTATSTFFGAHSALADVVTEQPTLKAPSLEVVVQSGVRGDVNHCPVPDAGKQPDNPMCFFEWDAPLATLRVNLPVKVNGKCAPTTQKIPGGLDLELGCASLVAAKGPATKQSRAYKFTVTVRDAAPAPHRATVSLAPGEVWKLGGFKQAGQAAVRPAVRPDAGADAGSTGKPKRASLLVQLKLAE